MVVLNWISDPFFFTKLRQFRYFRHALTVSKRYKHVIIGACKVGTAVVSLFYIHPVAYTIGLIKYQSYWLYLDRDNILSRATSLGAPWLRWLEDN